MLINKCHVNLIIVRFKEYLLKNVRYIEHYFFIYGKPVNLSGKFIWMYR